MVTAKQVLDGANKARRAGDAKAYDILYNEYVRLRDAERVAKYGKGVEKSPDEDTGIIGNLAKGFGSGAVGLVESAALGGATLLEEDAELKAREKIQSVAESFKPEGGDEDALSYKFGQGLGSIAAFLPTALLGKAALPAAGVLAVGAGSGEASERARAYGATEEERGTAAVKGAFVGATEIIPLGRLAKKLEVPFLSEGIEKISQKMGKADVSTLRGKLQSAALTGAIEGTQETAAAVLQNLVEQGYNPERLLIDAGVAEEGAIGGSAGATLQAFVDLFAGRRIKKAKAAAKEEATAQEEFEARQEAAREKRSDPQGDMFADELNEAEEAELARMEEEEKTSKEDPDEAELARMEAEEEKAKDEKERAKQIDLVDRIAEEEELDRMQAEEDAEKAAQTKADEKGAGQRKAQEVENLSSARDAEVEKNTRLKRREVLDEVLDDVNKSFPKGGTDASLREYIKQEFRKKMSEKGFRDPELSRGENRSVDTYLRLKGAEDFPMLPSDSDLSTLESRIKERISGQANKSQPTEGSVADTGREGVPSGTQQLGDKRATSANVTERTDRGGVASGVTDSGRPAGRKGRAKRPLRAAPKKPPSLRETPQEQLSLFDEPTVSETTNKVEYKQAGQVIPKHKNTKEDNATLDALSDITPEVEKSLPASAQAVTKYIRNFSDTKSALINAIYDVAVPNRKNRPKGVSAKESAKVLAWMNSNLSKESNTAIRKRIKDIRAAQRVVAAGTTRPAKKATPKQVLDKQKQVERETRLPSVRKNGKLGYSDSFNTVTQHDDLDNDIFVIKGLSKIEDPKSISKTAPTGTEQNEVLNDLKKVKRYFDTFSTPLDALTNYVHEKADPKRSQLFKGDAKGKILKGLSGDNTRAVESWIDRNLSETTREQLQAEIDRLSKQKKDAVKTEEKLLVESETTTTAEQKREEEARQAEEARVAEQKRVEKEKKKKEADEQAAVTLSDTSAKAEDSKPDRAAKAKKIADDNVADALNNPESDLTIKANYEKAKVHAKNSSKPKANLKAVEQKRKDQIEGKKQVKEAIENLDRNKLLMKLENKFEDKIDRLSLERAYELLGKKDLEKATLSEIKEAAKLQSKVNADALTLFDVDLEAFEAFSQTISGTAKEFLDRGDLKSLLRQIAKDMKNPRMKAIVRALEKNMGNTTITTDTMEGILRRGARPPKPGNVYLGMFFSGSNSIVINNEGPIYVHTILHEATHAATSVFIKENPNSPVVKKLNGLYQTMKEKGMLQNTYAAPNLKEFVAEAFTNPEFRAQLAATPFDYSNNKVVSAFQKFVNYIRDIFRIFRGDLAASSGSALDATDKWIYSILTPTPDNYVHNDADPLSIAKAVHKVINPVGTRLMAPINAIYNYIIDKSPSASTIKGIAMTLNLQGLVDLSRKLNGKLGESAYKLLKAIEGQQGLFEQYKRAVDKVHVGLKEFTKEYGGDAKSILDELIYNENFGATIYQVDPNKPRSAYEGRTDSSGNKLDEIWDLQQDHLNKMPNAKKAVLEQFNTMRKLYQQQWKILRKALGIEFASLGKDSNAEAVQNVASKIDQRLFARQEMEVYFPLVREGKFKLAIDQVVPNPDGTTRIEKAFLMFKHKAERDAFIRDIPNNPDVVTGSDKTYEGDIPRSVFSASPSGSFVSEILSVLEKNGVEAEIQERIISMYVNSLPETSYAKSLQKRLNRFGYIKDAKTALENKGYALASQSAKLESAAKIRAITNDITKISKEANDENVKAAADVLVNEHAKFATKGANNKGLEDYFKKANQIAFIYTLGLNFSSALVNLSQIPLFAIPMMAPRYGLDNALPAFKKAIRMALSANASIIEYYDINGEGEGATYTLKESMKRNIRNNSATEKEANERITELESMIPIIKMAHMRGKLPTADLLQEVGIQERAGFMDRVGHMSAYFFQYAERLNTQSTLLASYDLAINQMKAKKEAKEMYFSPSKGEEVSVLNLDEAAMQELAAEDAIWNTQEVNSGGRLETAPALSKQGIGRVAFMYKTYGIQMYYSMLKSAGIAFNLVFKNYSKEQRAIARQQLYGVHFSALMFAGIGGVPLYGVITMLYDLFRDDDEDTADEMVRKTFGELGFKGPLSTFTGMDVAARVKLTDLLFQHNRYMRDASVEESLMHYVGGPAWSTVKRFDRGLNDIANGEYQRALEAMIPTAGAGNALQAVRFYQDEGIMTRRGDFIYEDIGFGEIASKFLGFAPTEYTFRTEQNARDQRVTKAVQEERSKLHKDYYKALRFSDYQKMEEVRKDMLKFNKRHPTAQISSATIIKSMKSHTRTTNNMHNGVTVSPMLKYALERSREEYYQF